MWLQIHDNEFKKQTKEAIISAKKYPEDSRMLYFWKEVTLFNFIFFGWKYALIKNDLIKFVGNLYVIFCHKKFEKN